MAIYRGVGGAGDISSGITLNEVTELTLRAEDAAVEAEASATQAASSVAGVTAITSEIVTVAGIASNVTSVAGISTNVTTVAGVSTDVTTVAGISAAVTSVAGNTTNINAVAADATNIATVGGISTDVTAVAAIDSAVSAVAADATDIGVVSTDLAGSNTIGTVAGIAPNVTIVAGISTNVTAVASNATNVNTVATNIANVNTVGGISGDVTTVAGISSDVAAVENIAANVTTVAGISANVTTVAGISSAVTGVNAISSAVSAVNTNATNINTVAGMNANVTAVAGNATNINTVGGISGNVTTVAGISSDVTTVASNVTGVSNFANVYYGPATENPTERPNATASQEGDLYFNSTADQMRVFTGAGTGWVAAGSAVNGTTAREVYTANSNQTTFAVVYDAGYVDVYLNGVKLVAGTDFTATSGTNIVLATAATNGDIVDIVAYGAFALADVYTKAASDARYATAAQGAGTGVTSTYVSSVAVGGTTFAQPAVTGEINSDEGFVQVNYAGATGITVATLTSASTYVYIDKNGTLQQQVTEPTRQDWSRKMFTMRIAVDTTTNLILGFEYLNNPVGHYSNSIRDVYSFLLANGVPFKKNQTVTGRAGDLGFDIGSGSLLEFGGTGDIHNANIIDVSAVSNAAFFLSTRTAFDAGGNTNLPKFWDNAGTLTALGSTTVVGHRLYRFSNGNLCLQYGQGNYANMALAKAGALLEDYVLNPALANATFFGWWFIESTATNTAGTTLTAFKEYTIGVGGGISSALSGALLQGNNLSDVLDAATARTNLSVVGITDTQTLTNKTITGVVETKVAMAAHAIDLSLGNYFTYTLSGAQTLTVSNIAASGSVSAFVLEVTNGGSAALTFFSGVTWAAATPPTLTAAGVDNLAFFTSDGGTTWRGFVLGLGMA